jgi:hypothetical protein
MVSLSSENKFIDIKSSELEIKFKLFAAALCHPFRGPDENQIIMLIQVL